MIHSLDAKVNLTVYLPIDLLEPVPSQNISMLHKLPTHVFRTHLDLLYSNSMCRQSSMPTSILMLVFMSGYWESVCTAMSISRTRSERRRTIVTRRKYL